MKKQFLFVGALIAGLGMTACSSSVETTEGEASIKDAMEQLKEGVESMEGQMEDKMEDIKEGMEAEMNEQKDAMEETIMEKVEEVATEAKEEATAKGKETLKDMGM